MSDIALLGFKVDTSGLKKGERALESYARKGQSTEKKISKTISATNKDFLTLNKTIGIVAISFAALGGARLASELVTLADTWKNISSQIRQVTSSESELIKVRTKLFDITKDTRSELSNTVNLFAEMTRGTKDLNISQDRLLGVTRTLNNLFVAGGKPISETIGAIRQLNQGFASGVLRGEEFNAVGEGAPKILDAVGQALGKTRGELRAFAATGGITAAVMIEALEAYSDTAQKLADQTEKTFGQSFQAATTNLTKFIGESKTLNDIVNSLGSGIEGFSESLDKAAAAVKAMLIVVAIGLTPAMLAYFETLAVTTIAQLTAGTTAIVTANAYGVLATKAATATFATNLLGIATKFLLGPWGLLIAAIGVGAVAFAAAGDDVRVLKNEIDNLNETVEETPIFFDGLFEKMIKLRAEALKGLGQEVLREQLTKTLGSIVKNEAAIERLQERGGSFARQTSFRQALKLDQATVKEITKELSALNSGYDNLSNALKKLVDKLDPTAAALRKFEKNQRLLLNGLADLSIGTVQFTELNDLLTASYEKSIAKTDEVKEAFDAQIAAIQMQTQELLLSADAFELYAATQEAIANKSTPAMIKAIEKAIKVNQKLKKELKLKKEFKNLVKDIDGFGGAWTRTGSIVIDVFGDISDVMTDYVKQIKEIDKLEERLAKARKDAGGENAETEKLQLQINEQRVDAELSGLKSLASAGASLFGEKTAAAKAFAALSKIIAIAEIALSFQKIAASTAEAGIHVANEGTKQGANSLTAITAAFGAPWPIGFIAGAAMIAIMASLLGGSGGGGSSGPSLQDTQGTGTVLGDSGAKSSSIANATDRLEGIQIEQLAELRGIQSALTDLSLGIKKLAGDIAGGALSGFEGVLKRSSSGITGFFGSVKETILDSGIQFIAQSLGDIIDGGILAAQQFFDIKRKKKKFGGLFSSSSFRTEIQGLDLAIQQQMGAIFSDIASAVLSAAQSLGFESVTISGAGGFSDAFEEIRRELGVLLGEGFGGMLDRIGGDIEVSLEEALSRFNIDIGQISLEGLSGEEIEAELQAVFSQQADLIAEFLVPSIAEYQLVGEGLFDTLIRVSKEQAVFNDAIANMGFNLTDLSNIMQIDIAQSIINMVGGLNEFSDLSQSFFENFLTEAEQFAVLESSISDVFDSLGLSISSSREEFTNLIQGIDLTTAEGQELLAILLMITPALGEFFDELERIESDRIGLTIELLKLQGNAEAALAMERAIELEALDESLRALQELIFAEEDRNALLRTQTRIANDAFSMLERAIDLERERAEALLESSQLARDSEIERIGMLRAALEQENVLRLANVGRAKDALNSAFDAEIDKIRNSSNAEIKSITDISKIQSSAAKAALDERLNLLGIEKDAISENIKAMRSIVNNVLQSLGLDKSLNLSRALTSAKRGDFSEAQILDFSALSNLDPNKFLSFEDLAVQQAINNFRLKSLGDLAEKELNKSEQALSEIEQQIESMRTNTAAQINAINLSSQSQNEAIMSATDAQISALEAQRNDLLDIDTSVLSVADAITLFRESQAALDDLNFEEQNILFDEMIAAANALFALEEQAFEQEIARLDDIITSNEALLNAALGIDSSILSVADAIVALSDSLNQLNNTNLDPTAPAEPTDPTEPVTLPPIFGKPPLPIFPPLPPIFPPLPPIFDESLPPIFDKPPLPTIPPQPPIMPNASAQTTNIDVNVAEEIKRLREENRDFQIILVRNSTTSARALQEFKLNGMDTRVIA